jgi:2-polyprenyl-6-methoxyphenol hydroxylase-like FAD-dependent oxidoreductase
MGPDSRQNKWNGMICAFQLQEQVPSFAAADSVISARAGRAVWVFGLADRPPTVLLTYRTNDVEEQFAGSPIQRLRTIFSGMDDPAVRHALDSLEQAPDFLFDSVHQVKMPRWSKGRVVLLGDAAWCPNLYSGMGATSALLGGAELGRALRENPGDLPDPHQGARSSERSTLARRTSSPTDNARPAVRSSRYRPPMPRRPNRWL